MPYDPSMDSDTAAAVSWAEKRRSLTDPEALWAEPDAITGTLTYAGLLWRGRGSPSGLPGYDELGGYTEEYGTGMSNVYRLIGEDAVTA